jgi:cytochrome c
MVQFCMIVPMADEPLPWDSTELAALTAYVQSIQPGYHPVGGGGAANPCNPCGMKNPCNPCAMKR